MVTQSTRTATEKQQQGWRQRCSSDGDSSLAALCSLSPLCSLSLTNFTMVVMCRFPTLSTISNQRNSINCSISPILRPRNLRRGLSSLSGVSQNKGKAIQLRKGRNRSSNNGWNRKSVRWRCIWKARCSSCEDGNLPQLGDMLFGCDDTVTNSICLVSFYWFFYYIAGTSSHQRCNSSWKS